MASSQWRHVVEGLDTKLEMQEEITRKIISDKIGWVPKHEESL